MTFYVFLVFDRGKRGLHHGRDYVDREHSERELPNQFSIRCLWAHLPQPLFLCKPYQNVLSCQTKRFWAGSACIDPASHADECLGHVTNIVGWAYVLDRGDDLSGDLKVLLMSGWVSYCVFGWVWGWLSACGMCGQCNACIVMKDKNVRCGNCRWHHTTETRTLNVRPSTLYHTHTHTHTHTHSDNQIMISETVPRSWRRTCWQSAGRVSVMCLCPVCERLNSYILITY